MKAIAKLLGAIALGATLTGAAFAGPSNPTASFAGKVTPAKSTDCPHVKAQTTLVASANPKVNAPSQKVTGYVHEGCHGAALATMTCGVTAKSCEAMRKG